MKKIVIYIIAFVLIIFIIPAIITKKTKTTSVLEQNSKEQSASQTKQEQIMRW